jgi:hypothetical protein
VVVDEEESSGAHSGEPQSRRMRTSSIWSRYARGVVLVDLAAPESGVNHPWCDSASAARDKFLKSYS